MALRKEELIQELKGPDPQPAIRNALHLAAIRNNHPETLRYL